MKGISPLESKQANVEGYANDLCGDDYEVGGKGAVYMIYGFFPILRFFLAGDPPPEKQLIGILSSRIVLSSLPKWRDLTH